MKGSYQKYILNFKQPSGTSRGVLHTKETWFLKLTDGNKFGIGECGLFRGLSIDDKINYEEKLKWVCQNLHLGLDSLLEELKTYPSIQFGLEQAFISIKSDSPFHLFPSSFTSGDHKIPINGLIWMGSESFMKQQIKDKINAGFTCIKMKIGAIDFETELSILKSIRKEYSVSDIELRVDANGAFNAKTALENLKKLSECNLHSIEQPIKQGQIDAMAKLCETTPLPVALDEELIGISSIAEKQKLLRTIKPQYIILKPSLIGGFGGSEEWINTAKNHDIGWWVTSALESNLGLNAIAQWTFTLNTNLPQGLGTGSLFTNNFNSPLMVENGYLRYIKNRDWEFNLNI